MSKITGKFKSCPTCNKSFWVVPCQEKESKGKFCSKKCFYSTMKGMIPWNKGKQIKLKCPNCKKTFYLPEYKIKLGMGKYCSNNCFRKFKKKHPYGYKKKKGKYFNCLKCNKEFYVIQSRKKKAKYCSLSCYWKDSIGKHFSPNTEFTSERMSGKNNPFYGKKHSVKERAKISKNTKGKPKPNLIGSKNGMWIDGRSFEPYSFEFNNNLKEQIRFTYLYYCQLCGIIQECLNKKLQCHHIDYNKKNNKPNNLIPLCIPCHGKTNSNRKYWTNFFQEKVIL